MKLTSRFASVYDVGLRKSRAHIGQEAVAPGGRQALTIEERKSSVLGEPPQVRTRSGRAYALCGRASDDDVRTISTFAAG